MNKTIQHLACIMDGNRRWARQQGWVPWLGHKKGLDAAERTVDFCLEHNIKYLSLYTFSIENFKRPSKELDYLFGTLFAKAVERVLDVYVQKGVCIQFIGDRDRFPSQVLKSCERIEQATKNLNTLQVQLLFCYGGQQEIVHGVKRLAQKVRAGELDPEDITHDSIQKELWMAAVPAPELIVRTGGVHRLSNFLTFQSVYSELYFLDTFWPDIQKKDLQNALDYFLNCRRNFGK